MRWIVAAVAAACTTARGAEAGIDRAATAQFLEFSALAYCLDCLSSLEAGAGCSAKPYLDPAIGPGFKLLGQLDDKSTDTHGYVAAHTTNRFIVVVFRGTEDLRNWITNLHGLLSQFPASWNIDSDIKVHEGFLAVYQTVRPALIKIIDDARSKYIGWPIYLTGHSLGAALAVVAAIDFAWVQHVPVEGVYNYGSPRLGNSELFTFLDQFPLFTLYRVTHRKDIVVHLPPSGIPFEPYVHLATEYFQADESWTGTLRQCDGSGEDPSCADQYSAMSGSVSDHCTYLNVSIGVNGC